MFSTKLVATAIGFFFAILPSFAAGAEYTIKLQSYYPAGMMDAEKQFAESIKKKTNGKVEIIAYSAGELVPSEQILNAVKTGTIGMGRGMGHHFTELPTGAIESGLPLAWTSVTEAENIYMKEGLAEIISKEYAKHGIKYLGPIMAAPYQMLGKRPIKSIADLKKMKIRAVGAAAKMLNSVGVKTVSMPPEDIYLALTTGQIDGVLYGSPFEYKTTKYYEGARFLNTSSFIDPIVDTLIVNKRIWDSMPADLQESVQEAADEFRTSYYSWITSEDKKAIDTLFKNTQTSFSAEDIATLTKASIKIWEEEAKKSASNKKAVDIIINAAKKAGRL